jgi:hypothetical protein
MPEKDSAAQALPATANKASNVAIKMCELGSQHGRLAVTVLAGHLSDACQRTQNKGRVLIVGGEVGRGVSCACLTATHVSMWLSICASAVGHRPH